MLMIYRSCCLLLLAAGAFGAQERREVILPPEPEEPTYEVQVEIDVVEGPRREAVPAPGAVIELGVGMSDEKASSFWACPVLARVVADEDGLIRSTLAVPERWAEEENGRVWARVAIPGHTRNTIMRHVQNEKNTEPTSLSLYRGGSVIGTVLDDAGQPVRAADVGLYLTGAHGVTLRRAELADHAGRFALTFIEGGTYELQARARGIGSGGVGSLSLSPELSCEPVEIRLKPGVALSGRVLDPAGHPVPGLTITVVPAAGLPDELHRMRAEAGGGVLTDTAVTQRDGCFGFANLVPEKYSLYGDYRWIRSPTSPLPRWRHRSQRARPPEGPPAGTLIGVASAPSPDCLEFVMRAHRFEITVVDDRGARVDTAPALARRSHESPNAPSLQVLLAGDVRLAVRGFQVEELTVFPVSPEQEYVVSWQEQALPYYETEIAVDWNRHRVPLQIELGPRGKPAELTVRVLGPNGREYEDGPTVVVLSAEGGREVATTLVRDSFWGHTLEGSTWNVALPPGRYVVEANTYPNQFGCIAPRVTPREPLVSATKEIELFPGDQYSVDLRLGAGGHIDFEALQPRDHLSSAEEQALFIEEVVSAETIEAAWKRLGGASVILVSSKGERLELSRFSSPGSGWRLDACAFIVQGWSARGLDPAPVGDWTLRLEREGELLLERRITIRAGEVTTVRW